MSRPSLLISLVLLLPVLAGAAPIVPDAAVMKLDEIGTYRLGYQYRGKQERYYPVGWSGFFEERTGVACLPYGRVEGRSAFLLHCPWRGGTGVTFQDFDIRLPHSSHITLTGATAMLPDAIGKSDGATFRIFIDGKKVLDENRTDAVWKPFDIDLTSYAGRTVTIRFETDPGPKDNPGWDYSVWGDRTLRIAGFRPTPVHFPSPPPLDLRKLASRRTGGVVPPSGCAGKRTVALAGSVATLRYTGKDGLLTYRWRLPSKVDDSPLGLLTLDARMKGARAVHVPLAGTARLVWARGAAEPGAARFSRDGDAVVMTRAYRLEDATATVRVTARLLGKSLVLDVSCDTPALAAFEAGQWGPLMRRRPVTVPYYSGQVFYLPNEDLFVNAFLDWTHSNASSQDGTHAVYEALTDGRHNRLRERVIFAAAWHLDEVLPNIPNSPSPYRADLGRRLVLDIWGGRYADIARDFDDLATYGVNHCYAIVHAWQHFGYDNGLPQHYPANADFGTEDDMRTLASTGERLGYEVALHENYVDYYPDYPKFNPKDIALEPDGKRMLAWYNPGTKIQSFAEKPTAILRLAATQSPEIHRRYRTNACYLDVHSAVPPWFHVDADATQPGAGMFSTTFRVHRDLWAYERKVYGGPVTGEGNNHWYWSGLLDASEAQLGQGWAANHGMSAPLMVDFDLLKMHPLALNHGMGYYERWWGKPQWGSVPPMVVLDQYRMQEVAYGHAAFLAASTWNVPAMAWLEDHLVTPVTSRYATADAASIRYQVHGKWVDPTAAAKADDWSRVQVRYTDGLTLTANNAAAPMTADGLALPRFGWVAHGAGVTAYTAIRQGDLVDYAETPTSVFANARSARDWNISGLLRVRPEVADLHQTGPRRFSITYRWKVTDRPPADYVVFVHFSTLKSRYDPYDEGIRFQGDHSPAEPTSTWNPGTMVTDGPLEVTVPDSVGDGDYAVCVGMYKPGVVRVPIEGVDDGHGRVILGTVHVRDNGATITFDRERGTGEERTAIYLKDVNAALKVVDFGAVRTDGSVFVERDGADWVLRALPRDRAFTVELQAPRFGRPSAVRCVGGSAAEVRPVARGGWWRLPLCGATEYRWRAER